MFNINEEKETRNFIDSEMAAYPLFDFYRIVDTKNYMVYKLEHEKLVPQGFHCYDIWHRGGACQNCISSLAISQNRTIVKMETVNEKIYLIETIPLPKLGAHFALELISDVTGNFLVGNVDQEKNLALAEIIQRMNDLATHDAYTCLYNKHYIETQLQKQVLGWTDAKPLVIALLDIDRFKSVNDTYGHLAGDQVILTLSQALQTCAEKYQGWAGRVGGDEFLLSVEGVSLNEAELLMQNFCEDMSKIDFGKPKSPCHIKLSVGIVEYKREMGNWKTLFDLADKAMYSHKQH